MWLPLFVWRTRSAGEILRPDLLDVELRRTFAHGFKYVFEPGRLALDPARPPTAVLGDVDYLKGPERAIIAAAQGICFAVPINTARYDAGRLIKDGKITRSYIGVGGQNVPLHRRIVRFYNLPLETGVLVVSVEKDSPAQRAGLREGDVIIAFNEQPIGSIHELHKMLMGEQIGVEAKLLIGRHTEKLVLAITPAESPSR